MIHLDQCALNLVQALESSGDAHRSATRLLGQLGEVNGLLATLHLLVYIPRYRDSVGVGSHGAQHRGENPVVLGPPRNQLAVRVRPGPIRGSAGRHRVHTSRHPPENAVRSRCPGP